MKLGWCISELIDMFSDCKCFVLCWSLKCNISIFPWPTSSFFFNRTNDCWFSIQYCCWVGLSSTGKSNIANFSLHEGGLLKLQSISLALLSWQANLAKDILVFDMAILYYIHHCLLYALYAFEYKWFNMSLDFRLRVQLIETHWPYFCGFGTPIFILTHLPFWYYSVVLSACVFSFIFPFFIISATKAETPSETPAFRFYIIEVSIRICDTVFKLLFNPKTTVESRQRVSRSPPPG